MLTTITPWSNEAVGAILSTSLASTLYPTANLAFYVPFAISRSVTVVDAFCYNGAAVLGNVDVGIFAKDGTTLVTTGAIAQSGTNVLQKLALVDTVLRGPMDFYMGFSASSAVTTTLFAIASTAEILGALGVLQEASANPLPTTTATFAAMATAFMPFFGITINTTL